MNSKKHMRLIVAITLVIGLIAPFSYAQQATKAANKNAGKKEFTFHGRVEKIDPKAKMLTINGEKVEGWMSAMTMAYPVDKEEVLNKVKVGDQITARVYEGEMTLHDVRVVPPAPEKKAAKTTPKK